MILSAILAAAAGLGFVPQEFDPVRIEKRIQELQPKPAERRFDEIGWVAGGLREALTLARENNRPVFLFSHDGRMAVGRC